MKKFLILFIANSFSAICQNNKLSGIYTEYKRTLWNDEDGSKYTLNQKPFEPKLQFEFKTDSNTVVLKNISSNNTKQFYSINKDTLIIKLPLSRGEKRDTIYNKYIIIENKKALILRDYKPGVTKNHYIKKYYFKRSEIDLSNSTKDEPKEIYTIVDEMPSYPNGVEEMKKFIYEEVNKSKLKGVEKVFLKLLINPEGKIKDVEILNNPQVEYVEEAIKITRKFPVFTPGKQNGKPVFVYYNFPIFFKDK